MAGLEGKVALVTGAGGMRGVGRATALKLAALGADVALTDVRRAADDLPPAEVRIEWQSIDSVAEEVSALGRRALPVYCDLGQSGQIQDLVNRVTSHFGKIDILVNNARAVIYSSRRESTPAGERSKAYRSQRAAPSASPEKP